MATRCTASLLIRPENAPIYTFVPQDTTPLVSKNSSNDFDRMSFTSMH